MDRQDRMPGQQSQQQQPPAQSSAVRGLPDNPAQGRRPVPNSAAMSNGPHPAPPLPPIPNIRGAPSTGNLSATASLTAPQVIALTREAMRKALESEGQAAEASSVSTGVKSGVTVDLSRKGIQKLPAEVVDIMKDELERLALSHNMLSSLPARFAECTSLRYLNVRGNQFKEFPMALCDLKSLEILDLGRNQLRSLPSDLAKLSSLKVLSIPKNQIRELPLCLADMVSLQVLKFEGNPISFPPKDALQIQAASPPSEGNSEILDVTITSHIKRLLKQHVLNDRAAESETTGDEMSEAETPRFPLKRVASGRFPIRVSGSDGPDIRSPNMGTRPPPIPSRSHYRGLSQQSTAVRRPGVMPLTIGNVNERLRSNSETSRTERPESRNRRMGIVSKKTSDLGTLDEAPAGDRISHYRGLSHGSAMQGAPVAPVGTKSPATPTEPFLQRPIYVRRLSVLPERRRESKIFDPVIESAKGILYSVFQIHPMIQMLMTLTHDGSAKRSSLEIVFYNTNSHVEELEQEIQKHDTTILESEDQSPPANENVYRACQTLVSAYGHVCTLLADNIDTFVNNGDARYIRTLLMLLYNSIMELRVTLSSVSAGPSRRTSSNEAAVADGGTIRPFHREATAVPVAEPAAEVPAARSRNGTVVHNPQNLRVATDVTLPYTNGAKRTAIMTPVTAHTVESYAALNGRDMASDFAEEDAQFDKVFLLLQKSTDTVLRTLPNFNVQLSGGLRNAMQQRAPLRLVQDWRALIAMCSNTIQQTEILRNCLSQVKLKDPNVRQHPGFWHLCSNFIASWATMASSIKRDINKMALPPDTRLRLKPIQQSVKETSNAIVQSPWHHLLQSGAGADAGVYGSQGYPGAQTPITPQSAALGPAMQATVPMTPQNSSFAAAFHGNVFDRADALMANPGISMSRSGTMTRGHSNLSSLSSISSTLSDDYMAPSPNPSTNGASSFRANGVKGVQ